MGHFERECPEGKKEERITSLMTFKEEGGYGGLSGFFYMDGSYRELLINLKVGPKEKEVTFLVDSRAARSSLTILPRPHLYSLFSTGLNSRVKGEEFSVPLFEKFQDKLTWVSLLFLPEAGTNLLGGDLMSEVGIGIKVAKKNFEISLNLMTMKTDSQILSQV
jgi:hypothetical protein